MSVIRGALGRIRGGMYPFIALAVAVVMLSGGVGPVGEVPPVAAEDAYPCGEPYWSDVAQDEVQECPLWMDAVPVVADVRGAGMNEVVGYLDYREGNWFTCQLEGTPYEVPGTGYVNHWWAETMADNGEWGYVSQAYFKGGNNNEADGGNLPPCDGSEVDNGPMQQAEREVGWQACLDGSVANDAIAGTYLSRNGQTYELRCREVNKINRKHGFNANTSACIAYVLEDYDRWEDSQSDPSNDVFMIDGRQVEGDSWTMGNFYDAFVVVDPTDNHIVTSYVEIKTVDLMLPYEGDPWAACTPFGTSPPIA